MSWQALWRWYVGACVWVCSCGCTGPTCCECCGYVGDVMDQGDERRAAQVDEMFERIMYGSEAELAALKAEYNRRFDD